MYNCYYWLCPVSVKHILLSTSHSLFYLVISPTDVPPYTIVQKAVKTGKSGINQSSLAPYDSRAWDLNYNSKQCQLYQNIW